MAELTIYTTEAGSILLEDETPIASSKNIVDLIEKVKERGEARVRATDGVVLNAATDNGLEAVPVNDSLRASLALRKIELIVQSGLAPDQGAALEIIRRHSMRVAEEVIREASSRPDLHLVQAIQALDETDKYLNVTATRASEWYGLHFPELTQMMQDNVALCRMVAEIGRRDGFRHEGLQGRGLTDKKVDAILEAAASSKGGEISDQDIARVRALASQAVSLSGEREKLNEYVESAMARIAPNVAQVAGSTIGARLMAKAGGLDRLAVLPASTIQILGAEKALFRALRTGSRPPKHGILFQHQEVHMAPKWQRGKIARTLANKIAIAARVDYYRGTQEPSLKDALDKRIERIKEKYKEPPKRPELTERRRGKFRPDRRRDEGRRKFRRR